MKKMFMAVIAFMMTISASAQFYIYFSDGTVAKVDSISMIAPDEPAKPNETTIEIPAEAASWNIPEGAIDVLQAREICAALESGATTGTKYYVMGYVKKIHHKHADGVANYGNALFYMENVSGANSTDDFLAYQVYGLNGQKITEPNVVAVGDFVVVYGELTNYMGTTYETVGKGAAYIWNSTNALLSGGSDTPKDPNQPDPSAGIGIFSVSPDKQVTFSPGNLQYTRSTDTWSFAENQYDYIGTDNVTGGSVSTDATYGDSKSGTALADKVDLFGWSTSANNFGVSTSEDSNDYSGSFIDWGTNQIGADAPNTWRTLTYNEWEYLLYSRPNASSLRGVAQVNGVNGLILLPDNWTCPESVTFKSGFHSSSGVDYYAAYQTFTADQWSKMESVGAIFLPAAGYRVGTYVNDVHYHGSYWSATSYNGLNCCGVWDLCFHSDKSDMGDGDNILGLSVRLVKDL